MVISDGITAIGNYAFSSLATLTDVSIPDTVKEIGISSFSYCSKLENVALPEGLESISALMFEEDESLGEITIPKNVEEIGRCAFQSCSSLKAVTIPSKVSVIDDFAFYHCDSLETVKLLPEELSIGAHVFTSCDLKTVDYSGVCSSKVSVSKSMDPKFTALLEKHVKATDAAVAPTCVKTGLTEGCHCSVCSKVIKVQEEVKATGHSWDKGKVTKEATCTEGGVKTFTCTGCNAKKKETVKATGHKEVKDSAVAATFTKTGKTAGSHCSRCGYVIQKQTVLPMKTGLRTMNGKTYFYKNGKKQAGWRKVGTKKYYFDTKTGAMQTGWVKIAKKKYYFSPKKKTLGQMVTGKLKIGKKTYKFNKKGVCLNP